MKKLTTEEFISKSIKTHGQKYNYEESIYIDGTKKVKIFCNFHKEYFYQLPNHHFNGQGCRKCGSIKTGLSRLLSKESFIKNMELRFSYRYNYEDSVYITSTKKIIVECSKHGKFSSTPSELMSGKQCRKCVKETFVHHNKKSNEEFLLQANEKHSNFFNYEKTNYIDARTKLIVTCPIHGDFKAKPRMHLMKNGGCRKCAVNNFSEYKTSTTKEFLEKIIKIHPEYNYQNTIYTSCKHNIEVKCLLHGEFLINARRHLAGQKCPFCKEILNNYRKSDWIRKAKNKIGTFYILKCWNETEEFFKLGITFNSVKQRYAGKTRFPYEYKIIKEIKSFDLSYIWDLEKRFKRMKIYKKQQYVPKIHFGGKTECFKF